jgi:YHS domain-containing protein
MNGDVPMTIRFIGLLILVLVGLSVIRRLLGALQSPVRRPARTTQGGHLVKDPVCGTYVPAQTAISTGNEFFCSEECRSRFLARDSRK